MDYYSRTRKYIGKVKSPQREILKIRLHNKDGFYNLYQNRQSWKPLSKSEQFRIDFNRCIYDPTARRNLIEFIEKLDTLDEL